MNYEPQNEPNQTSELSPFAPIPSYANLASVGTASHWTVPQAILNWGGSIVFALLTPMLLILLYWGIFDRSLLPTLQKGELTAPIMVLQLVGTFGGQILSLILCWMIVTGMGNRSFSEMLGIQWAQNFKLWHAMVLGIGMFLLSGLLMYVLPRHETEMDKFLKFGIGVRLVLALVATIGAPIQEEIVYRGVLYQALEKTMGMRRSVVIVSLLFWAVHVMQYWQSIATLVAVLLLSFSLTALRAWSGKLLPCIATHLFFNGIQGVLIVAFPEKAVTSDPAAQTAMLFLGLFN